MFLLHDPIFGSYLPTSLSNIVLSNKSRDLDPKYTLPMSRLFGTIYGELDPISTFGTEGPFNQKSHLLVPKWIATVFPLSVPKFNKPSLNFDSDLLILTLTLQIIRQTWV